MADYDDGVLTAYHQCSPSRHKTVCKVEGRYEVVTVRPEPDPERPVVYEFKPMTEDLYELEHEVGDGDVRAVWFIDSEVAESRPKSVTA